MTHNPDGSCIVDPCPDPSHPRYPSSADLAALRRSIPYQPVPGIVHPFSTTGQEQHPIVGTAWDTERRHGIGARDRDVIPCSVSHVGGMRCAVEAGDRASRCRREAAALRSRAFEAVQPAALGDVGLSLDLDDAMHAYVPRYGSLVLSSPSCYHCGEATRHRWACVWNVER